MAWLIAALRGPRNPLRFENPFLPANLVLLAKLLAAWLLIANHVATIHGTYLPFVGVFDWIGHRHVVQSVLQVTYVTCALGILFNVRLRACALGLGATLATACLVNRAYYQNNVVFCALLLIFTGLHTDKQRSPTLLRAQVALVYFGAALNKALEPDWRSGQFMENWMHNILDHQTFRVLARQLPPRMLSELCCWSVIATELGLAALFALAIFRPRFRLYPIWLGILFHSSLLLVTGFTFNIFFNAAIASYLAFAEWPKGTTRVSFDPSIASHAKIRGLLARLDLDGRFDWQPSLGASMSVDGEALSDFRALRRLLLRCPSAYLLAALVCLPQSPTTWRVFQSMGRFTPVSVAFLLLLASPAFVPFGEKLLGLLGKRALGPLPRT